MNKGIFCEIEMYPHPLFSCHLSHLSHLSLLARETFISSSRNFTLV